MNDAHLHMIVNHFPIIGTIFGLGILISGMILKNNSVKNTAYVLFIVAAIFAAFSMGTGEGAEELVEDMPTVGKQIIHEHEEMAEKLALVLYVLGVISIVGLFLNYKKHARNEEEHIKKDSETDMPDSKKSRTRVSFLNKKYITTIG